ncbi:MAG: hypothetical protein ACK52I_18265 [Pseudomonadota bacterium]
MAAARRSYPALAVTCALVLAGCGRDAGTAPGADAAGGAKGGMAELAPGAMTGGAAGVASGEAAVDGDGAARAAAVRTRAESLPKVEGRWRHGDADSAFVARFDDGELRYLEERVEGPGGPRENRYFFAGGELWYYAGEQPAGGASGGGPGAMAGRVRVVAEFRGTEVVRGVSREHHGEKKLSPAVLEVIRRHAQALAGAAQDEWSALQAR